MELTQDDVHICRILFNEGTHAMALAMYGHRAKEIYHYVCNKALFKDFFEHGLGNAFEQILIEKTTASFFFDNDLVNFSCFEPGNTVFVLRYSPIAKEIWDSGVLDQHLHNLEGYDIYKILIKSPLAENIWDSGKLEPYLHRMDNTDIRFTLADSPIADKIYFSKKLPYIGKTPFNVYRCLIKRKFRKYFLFWP